MTEQNARIKLLKDRISTEIKNIFTDERYAGFLGAAVNFRRYSINNVILIFSQRADAKKVEGFDTWKNYGRNVTRDESGIQILAPESYTVIKNGGETVLQKFKIVYVYDISQTEGLPLIAEADNLPADVRNYKVFIETLKKISPIPIMIKQDSGEIQRICAAINEITRAKTDNPLEADSIFYSVCQYYGIETGATRFDYVTEWSSTRDISEMKSMLDGIRAVSSELINNIDETFREIISCADGSADDIPVIENNEPEQAVETEIDVMPDPLIGIAGRNSYGYTKSDMLPLSQEKAIELFNGDNDIFLLYPDNTEEIAVDLDEIYNHDGIFGIESAVWSAYAVTENTEDTELLNISNIETIEITDYINFDYGKENISAEISGQAHAVTNIEITPEITDIPVKEAPQKIPAQIKPPVKASVKTKKAKPPQKNNNYDKPSLLGMLEKNKAIIAKKGGTLENTEKEETF